jgi:hypothetical protein
MNCHFTSATRYLRESGEAGSRLAVREHHLGTAPFGLEWGMSVDAVKTLGAELSSTQSKYGASYSVKTLPRMVEGVETVFLSFGYDDRLWHIAAVSHPYSDDPYGTGARNRYDSLIELLAAKYGKGVAQHHRDSRLWTKPDEFVMGLSQGLSWWYTDFDSQEVRIQIGLGAEGLSTSYWKLIYWNKPLQANFESAQKSREKDAL